MTAATDHDRARSRASRRRLIDANPNQLCPPSHKHGVTVTCYNSHGCRCRPCVTERQVKRGPYDWNARVMRGDGVWVDAVGARRRLQALAYMGWSAQVIAEKIGSHYRPLMKIRAGEYARVRLSSHQRIAEVFEVLAMQSAPGRSGRVTRGHAAGRGWHGPLAWDDIDRDENPAE